MICCSGGITSKIFIRKLNQYVQLNQLTYHFSSISDTFVDEYAREYDIILFAPQTKPSQEQIKSLNNMCSCIKIIPESIYASMDCQLLFQFIESPMKTSEEKQYFTGFVHVMRDISRHRFVKVLVNSSVALGALMIVQALFSLILSLPLEAYQNFLDSSGLKSFFEIPIVVLSNSIGLIFSFVVAYQYRIDNKDKLFAGLLSMACYLLLIPIDVARQGSLTSIYTAMIDLQYMNSSGIFVAMISSLIFSKIYDYILRLKFLKDDLMKMAVSCVVVLTIYLCIRYIFMLTSYQNIFVYFNQFISMLLKPISEGVWGFAVFIFLSSLLYFIGIDGPQLIYTLILPLHTTIYYANITAFASNLPAPYPYWFLMPWVFMGGVGATLALNVLMIIKSKHTSTKTLGKLALMTSLFNINEPLIYGFPIVFNPFMFIPFTSIPLINLLICIIFMKLIPIVPFPTGAEISTYMPFGVGAMLTNNSWLGLLLCIGILIVDMCLYYPFFINYEKNNNHIMFNKNKK